jgi:hypothetical protein
MGQVLQQSTAGCFHEIFNGLGSVPLHPGRRKKRGTSINLLADSPLKMVIRIIKKGSKVLSLL